MSTTHVTIHLNNGQHMHGEVLINELRALQNRESNQLRLKRTGDQDIVLHESAILVIKEAAAVSYHDPGLRKEAHISTFELVRKMLQLPEQEMERRLYSDPVFKRGFDVLVDVRRASMLTHKETDLHHHFGNEPYMDIETVKRIMEEPLSSKLHKLREDTEERTRED